MQRANMRTIAMFCAPFLALAVIVCIFDVVVRSRMAESARTEPRLPDLDQEVPSELAIYPGAAYGVQTYLLAFRSAVVNVGAGPMVLSGARLEPGEPRMQVNQLVEREDGPVAVMQSVGVMEYGTAREQQHWQLLDFDHYELRQAQPPKHAVVAERKVGFCLEDRYRTTGKFAGSPPGRPAFTGRCGAAHPELLKNRMGIAVGYGDDYSSYSEGQQLPIGGLPDGHYLLVHRVNGDRRLKERSYSNNAASVLFDLRWVKGKPVVQVIATCPDTDRCDRLAPAPDAGQG